MITFYLILSTVLNFIMFVIWKKSDWVNTAIKMVFIAAAIFGVFLTAIDFGYIIAPDV